MENWAPIREFPGYSVSTLGRVRRDSTGRILVLKVNQYGVVYVGLMGAYEQRQRGVALLVASTFIPRPRGPFDTPINLNGDRWDNRVENLTWRPRVFAVRYNQQFKDPYDFPITSPVRDLETGEEYSNSFDCAVQNGLLERDVVLSILNRTYTWPTYQLFGSAEE